MEATQAATPETVKPEPRRKSVRPAFWRAETISQKLTLGFLLILALLAASGLVAYIELSVVGQDTRTMENASMQAMSASHLERLAETSLIPLHDYLLTGDPSAKAQFDQVSSELDAEVAALQGKPSSSSSSGADMPGMSTADAGMTQNPAKLS